MLGTLNEKKVADLLRQRPAAERHRQPGAVAGHDQCRHPRQRVVLSGRRARPGGPWRRWATRPGIAGRARHVLRAARRWRSRTNFQHSQDTLYALAADTGGKALLDNNDLSVGIVQAQKADLQLLHHRLLLDQRHAGRQVPADQDHAEGDTRPSWITGRDTLPARQFKKFTTADKERQLEDALMLGDPITELTIADGGELLPVESRRVLRAGGGEDSGQRTGAGAQGRRGAHAASISSAK